jgi:hypothetical protein
MMGELAGRPTIVALRDPVASSLPLFSGLSDIRNAIRRHVHPDSSRRMNRHTHVVVIFGKP